MTFTPQIFKRGDVRRLASSPSDAIKFKYEGWTAVETAAEPTDRQRLQARAKELGVPANQSNEALSEAIAAEEASS